MSMDLSFHVAEQEHLFVSPCNTNLVTWSETAEGVRQLRGMDGWQQYHAVP